MELSWIGEDDYLERMDSEVADFLQNTVQDDYFQSFDQKPIHYYWCVHPQEKATIVICHGFCEIFCKYQEMAWYFYQAGYSVFYIEHRGHGYSYRETEEPDMVYIGDFDQYVEDLHTFVEQIVVKYSLSDHYFLLGHSMGGCICGLFLEKYPQYFQRAVLCSPMMAMNTGGLSPIVIKILLIWSIVGRRQKKYIPGAGAFDEKFALEDSCSSSSARFRYTMEIRKKEPVLRANGASYGWTRAAFAACKKVQKDANKVRIPVLLLQAGKDSLVKPEGQEIFIERSAHTRKAVFPDSKHEIFNSTDADRIRFFKEIFAFLEE